LFLFQQRTLFTNPRNTYRNTQVTFVRQLIQGRVVRKTISANPGLVTMTTHTL